MNNIEGVIFDWAGTTVDFGCFAPVNVFLEIFKKVGIDVTVDEAREPMGMLKKDHIKAMLNMPRIKTLWNGKFERDFDENDIDELYVNFENMLMTSLSNFTDPLPGVLDTVKELREMGLKIGSTTGYTNSMMDIVVKGAKENGYSPDCFITPDDTSSCGRPYPYMIFRNMETLKLSAPWKVVKVGDTVADINEGINAGVWSVGVVVGSSQMGLLYDEYMNMSDYEKKSICEKTKKKFLDVGADFTINTLKELPKLINEINCLILDGKRPIAK